MDSEQRLLTVYELETRSVMIVQGLETQVVGLQNPDSGVNNIGLYRLVLLHALQSHLMQIPEHPKSAVRRDDSGRIRNVDCRKFLKSTYDSRDEIMFMREQSLEVQTQSCPSLWLRKLCFESKLETLKKNNLCRSYASEHASYCLSHLFLPVGQSFHVNRSWQVTEGVISIKIVGFGVGLRTNFSLYCDRSPLQSFKPMANVLNKFLFFAPFQSLTICVLY